MKYLEELFTPELAEAWKGQRSDDELCLAYAQRVRARKPAVRPELEYRCLRGCLLFACYATPAGVVVYHPTHRTSNAYGAAHPAFQSSMRPVALDSATLVPEYAHLLDSRHRAVLAQCRHGVVRRVDADELREVVAVAARAGKPDRRRCPVEEK